MRKQIKDFLVPHKGNNHKPKLFHLESMAFLLVMAFVLFGLTFFATDIARRSNLVATVLPGILVDMANDTRTQQSETPLVVNPKLVAAAQAKADDMAEKGYFAHYSPDNLSPWYWIGQAGYNFSYAGENLAVNFTESTDVNQAWLNSPTHRANIVNDHFTEVGIATARGIYKGKEAIFVVQMFGRPLAVAPKTIPQAPTTDSATGVSIVSASINNENSLVSETPEAKPLVVVDQSGNSLTVQVAGAEAELVPTTAVSSNSASQNPWWAWIVVRPGTITGFIYIGVLLFVLLDLIFMILVEIKTQHYASIFIAISFLLVISTLFFLSTYTPLANIVLNYMVTTA
jgi:hypothetical protein